MRKMESTHKEYSVRKLPLASLPGPEALLSNLSHRFDRFLDHPKFGLANIFDVNSSFSYHPNFAYYSSGQKRFHFVFGVRYGMLIFD